ncbi:MAG: Gfo/Idh/MocA family oxidoreductase [Spirochaetaceae bacterium]|nr:Gfo/Idh/MocA family oxidoreductase [Spirochaetaceae bacterium]
MKFGIVGTGMIAEFHARAIAEIPGSSIVACFDALSSRAQAFAAKHGGRAYDDLGAFLRDPEMEIVNVCSPSGAHLDSAIPAAESGRHLIVEKPLEISVARCMLIVDAADRAGVTLSGIFPSRFDGAARVMKAAVEAKRFGALAMGRAYVKWWREQAYYSGSGWKGTKAMDGGGALMNQSIHAIDLLLWYMGEARRVCAFTGAVGHTGLEIEDNAAVALEFKSGALGAIQGSTATWPGFLKRVEVMGTAGSAILEEESLAFWKFAVESTADDKTRARYAAAATTGGGASDPTAIGHAGHRSQIEDVIRSIRERRKPLVDGIEATRAVAIIEAIYESAATGKPAVPTNPA